MTSTYAAASSPAHSSARTHCAATTQVTTKITLAPVSPGPRHRPRRSSSAAATPIQNSSERTTGKIWVNHQVLSCGTRRCPGQSATISSGTATTTAHSTPTRARRTSGSANGRQK